MSIISNFSMLSIPTVPQLREKVEQTLVVLEIKYEVEKATHPYQLL